MKVMALVENVTGIRAATPLPNEGDVLGAIQRSDPEVTAVEYQGLSTTRNCGHRMFEYWAFRGMMVGADRPENLHKVSWGMYRYCANCGLTSRVYTPTEP